MGNNSFLSTAQLLYSRNALCQQMRCSDLRLPGKTAMVFAEYFHPVGLYHCFTLLAECRHSCSISQRDAIQNMRSLQISLPYYLIRTTCLRQNPAFGRTDTRCVLAIIFYLRNKNLYTNILLFLFIFTYAFKCSAENIYIPGTTEGPCTNSIVGNQPGETKFFLNTKSRNPLFLFITTTTFLFNTYFFTS